MGLTLTKSELKNELQCTTWARFYKVLLTRDVIERELKLSLVEYKRIREFTVDQTRILRRYFNLPDAENRPIEHVKKTDVEQRTHR